jgi:hypothetical protein
MKWINALINKFFSGEATMANTNDAPYTEEMVARMVEEYTKAPTRETVQNLADFFGKTTRSITAKLSREGVYQAAPRTTKSGGPVVSKQQFVDAIQAHFGTEFPTLVKTGKQDLQKLAEALGVEVAGV